MGWCPIDDEACKEKECNMHGRCNDRLAEKPIQSASNVVLADDPDWVDKLSPLMARAGLRAALMDVQRLINERDKGLSESSLRHFVARREEIAINRCIEIAEQAQCEFHCNNDGDVAAAIRLEFNLPKAS